MKKTLSLVLLAMGVMILFAAAGCGSEEGTGEDADADLQPDPDSAEETGADPDAGADTDGEKDAPAEPDGEADMETIEDGEDAPDGTGMETLVIDDSSGFKSRAALALAPDGSIHVAYNIATSADGWDTPSVWYATNAGGTWTRVEAAPAGGVSNEFPVIVVDSGNRPHIFYNRFIEAENQTDIFYLAGDGSGGFSATANVTQTTGVDEYAPSAAIDQDDVIHLLFQNRTGDPYGGYTYSVGYLAIDGGAPSAVEEVAADAAQFGLNPDYDIAVSPDGTIHAVYCKPGSLSLNNVLYSRVKRAATWEDEERLTPEDMDVWGPEMDVDSGGDVHLACAYSSSWDEKTLYYLAFEGGSWTAPLAISTSLNDRSYYLGLDAVGAGEVHIAFHRFYEGNADILCLRAAGGSFDPEVRVTETADLDEGTPAVAAAPGGTVYISYTENLSEAPNGTVYLVTIR